MQNTTPYLKCSNCGNRVRWSYSFCPFCGSDVKLTREKATVDLPELNDVVGKNELWGLTPKAETDSAKDSKTSCPTRKTLSSAAGEKNKKRRRNRHTKYGGGWRESLQMFYRSSPRRAIMLSTLVLVDSLMFFPYAYFVLNVFQYSWICAVLIISSATVLLTHAVCVCNSYRSIIWGKKENKYVEIPKAIEKTQSLLSVGVVLFSIFLLAFCLCLKGSAAAGGTNSAASYEPVSFDN